MASASGYLSATFLLLPLGYPSAGLPLGGCLSALPLGCISATVRLPRTAAAHGCLSAAEPRLPLRYLLSLASITPAASFLETVATLLLQSGHEDSVSYALKTPTSENLCHPESILSLENHKICQICCNCCLIC